MTREGYRWQARPWRPSDAQARILDAVAEGKTNAEIAAEIGMTIDGVKWHISRALSETGLDGRRSLGEWWQGGPRMSISPVQGRARSRRAGLRRLRVAPPPGSAAGVRVHPRDRRPQYLLPVAGGYRNGQLTAIES